MAQPVIQASFNTGEFAPALNARVDLQKYHSAAALLKNFFVDYRGGASTRPGTKYILQAKDSAHAVRLVGFQASFTVSYELEFGQYYLRFYSNGSPILEDALTITGATQANPCVVSVVNSLNPGDIVYITGVLGMTQLNNAYYRLSATAAGNITLADLNGVAINSSAFGAWTSGGTVQRVYTIATPYAGADLQKLKFAPNVSTLVLTHSSYVPYVLTLIAADNWTLVPIVFGTTVATPTGVSAATTLGAGTVNYSYVVTAVDANGQESAASTAATLANKTDLRTVAGTNRITWSAVAGAVSYNVYKAQLSYTNVVAAGAAFGFIGNVTGLTYDDSNTTPDFSLTIPVAQNPFQGAGVDSVTITASGAYTTVPTATFDAAPSGGSTAAGAPYVGVISAVVSGGGGGGGHVAGDIIFYPNGVALVVATVNGPGSVLTFQPMSYPGSNPGAWYSGATPSNPQTETGHTGSGSGQVSATLTWGVIGMVVTNRGAGYTTTPAITFSAGAATATAVLDTASAGNPDVPGYFQQRLVLAAQTQAPQSFFMSQPGSYYNFNTTEPAEADDGIFAALVSGQLNTIKSMVSMPPGLVMLSDKAAWLINGGSNGSVVTVESIVANAHSYNGACDIPPIVANFDILYVQSKGSIVRDLSYNFYANIFTGTDISILSSHLFYGYTLTEWAWAEEPFKVVWAVRDDGTMLTLTFLKEQELIGWCHSDTNGEFKSVCAVTEQVDFGSVDAVYTVVERVINGNTVKYIERFAERIFPNGVEDAWCVDAGLQYDSTPATTFTGAQHLAGATVTGLADGVVIPPFVMPTNGTFTLTSAASKVTVGLVYTPQLKTLAIDLGEPTVQGKMKTIPQVTIRVEDALGLSIGKTFDTLVPMKDLVIGNVGSATNEVVTDLVTGDARTILDPSWTVPGQYCIEQPYPFPATILGVIPQIAVGDTGAAPRGQSK